MTRDTSKLWETLSSTVFSNVDDEFVETFRKPGGANNRLGSWDPVDPTYRYFKFILYSAAIRQPDRFFSLYKALGAVDIGSPVSVKVRGCDINIDYLLAIDEFLFLESCLEVDAVESVIEIGAGFGRTCHALLAHAKNLDRYTIVDLPNVLELSRRVLQRVAPQLAHKVRFLDATDRQSWAGLRADLAINIDSMQEMPPAAIDAYMDQIVSNCAYFYLKNPVAKYHPGCVGIVTEDGDRLHDVFALGYCRDVIDIFNDEELANARKYYLEAYLPSPGWRVAAERQVEIFPYFQHALFRSE